MVKHVLKNGTVLDDITGHLVKREEVPSVYTLIERKGEKDEQAASEQDL